VDFLVLGPVAVLSNGAAPLELGPPKARAALATLLCRPGRVVSVEALVDALWPEAPPATAVKNVQLYVHQLRRALGEAARIRRHDRGYLLAAEPDEIDAVRFTGLVERYRAVAGADLEQARALLEQALGLWRGDQAYAGVGDVPPVAAQARRLGEARLAALGARIDVDLRLGRHDELVPELTALTAEHPLDERFWGQLMTALHRSGRAAAALAAFDRARRVLVEEAGLDPGPELRDIQQAVLVGQGPSRGPARALAKAPPHALPAAVPPSAGGFTGQHGAPPWQPAGTPAPVPGPPAQLPPDVMAFTGRAAELTQLAGLAASGGGALPIAVISGGAGVGKTGLAVHWSHQAAARFPDGQLFADLRGYDEHDLPLPASAVLDQFLRALGVPGPQVPAGVAGRTALLRTVLNGRRVLVVLDNARTADQVRPLLPGSGTCFVLVTSRSRLDDLVALDGARGISLSPLPLPEAASLLIRATAASAAASDDSSGGQVSSSLAARIACLCDRLPLAIRIAAARVMAHPAAVTAPDVAARAVAGLLIDEQRRLTELSVGSTAVRASFALSYRELPSRAAELLRRLGLLDVRDFAAWVPAALLDTGLPEATELLGQLARAGLLEVAGADHAGQARYRLHDLIRLFAREQADPADGEATRRDAVSRFLAAALQLAQSADAMLGNPFVVPFYGRSPRYSPTGFCLGSDPFAWLQAERAVLTSAVAQAARLGFAGYAWEITAAMSQFLSTRRYLDDWEECARRAVAAARAAGDERGEAAALLQLADRSADAGRPGEAARLLVRAIHLLRRGGDPRALAIALTTRALLLLDRNGPAAAQRDAEHALGLLPPTGPTPWPAPPGESAPAPEVADPARCRALTALGLSYLKQGNHEAARERFGEALDSQRTVRGRAEARYRLGTVHLLQGDYRTAAQELADAMQAAYQAGDLMTAMIAQVRLGQAHVQLGALEQAQPLLEQAASRLSGDDSPKLQALSMQELTRVQALRDQVPVGELLPGPSG